MRNQTNTLRSPATHLSNRAARFAFLILALMLLLFAAAGAARAATYTVTDNSDNDPGSLRQAIAAAISTPDNDTITFACGNPCNIVLTSGPLVYSGAGRGQIGALTIFNSGVPNSVVISGNNTDRVFLFNAIVTLDGVTVTNGNNPSLGDNNCGGGIYNEGSLEMTNSTVSGNTANIGGGVYGHGIDAANSVISGNTASLYGGGIYFSSPDFGISEDTLINVTVTLNRSTDATCTVCSGGIDIYEGGVTLDLNNTIVAGNTVANAQSSPDLLGAVATTSS